MIFIYFIMACAILGIALAFGVISFATISAIFMAIVSLFARHFGLMIIGLFAIGLLFLLNVNVLLVLSVIVAIVAFACIFAKEEWTKEWEDYKKEHQL